MTASDQSSCIVRIDMTRVGLQRWPQVDRDVVLIVSGTVFQNRQRPRDGVLPSPARPAVCPQSLHSTTPMPPAARAMRWLQWRRRIRKGCLHGGRAGTVKEGGGRGSRSERAASDSHCSVPGELQRLVA
jgi:hypothetical protein